MARLALNPFPSIGFPRPEFMSGWWDEFNESPQWQDVTFFTLCAAYALVSAVALIQLIRIELRVPEYGWTTQKVFHFMNFIVNGVRAGVFGFHMFVFALNPKVLTSVLLDLPGLLFFTTYTLLVLFWAEIYYQARSLPTDKLRAVYITVNCIIYFVQACIWFYMWIDDSSFVKCTGQIFIAAVSFIAALGFLQYGGSLFSMLRRFPIESKGRRKKLHEGYLLEPDVYFMDRTLEPTTWIQLLWGCWSGGDSVPLTQHMVGAVTAICCTCFLIRCVMVVLSAFDADASLNVLDHPILDLIYYTVVEILPSAFVLFILRKLPPKRVSAQYHQIQ